MARLIITINQPGRHGQQWLLAGASVMVDLLDCLRLSVTVSAISFVETLVRTKATLAVVLLSEHSLRQLGPNL